MFGYHMVIWCYSVVWWCLIDAWNDAWHAELMVPGASLQQATTINTILNDISQHPRSTVRSMLWIRVLVDLLVIFGVINWWLIIICNGLTINLWWLIDAAMVDHLVVNWWLLMVYWFVMCILSFFDCLLMVKSWPMMSSWWLIFPGFSMVVTKYG